MMGNTSGLPVDHATGAVAICHPKSCTHKHDICHQGRECWVKISNKCLLNVRTTVLSYLITGTCLFDHFMIGISTKYQ